MLKASRGEVKEKEQEVRKVRGATQGKLSWKIRTFEVVEWKGREIRGKKRKKPKVQAAKENQEKNSL